MEHFAYVTKLLLMLIHFLDKDQPSVTGNTYLDHEAYPLPGVSTFLQASCFFLLLLGDSAYDILLLLKSPYLAFLKFQGSLCATYQSPLTPVPSGPVVDGCMGAMCLNS